MNIKKHIRILIVFILLVLIGGSRKVYFFQYKSNKKIAESENRLHGKCTIISKKTKFRYREVVLFDELQGFEYKVIQKPQTRSHVIFGGGTYEYVWRDCNFDEALINHIGILVKDSLDKLCEERQISYSLAGESRTLTLYISKMADPEIVEIIEECAKLFGEYNLEGRLDCLNIDIIEKELCYDGRGIKYTEKGWYRIGVGEYKPRAEKDAIWWVAPVNLDDDN